MEQEVKITGDFEKIDKIIKAQKCSGVIYLNKKHIGKKAIIIIKNEDQRRNIEGRG